MSESQNIEYKQSWRDEYLKWISGFANAQGGTIYIGMDDAGHVTGLDDAKKLLDDIPNKTVNHLGIVVDVNLLEKRGREYLEIMVPISQMPISYHGAYHYRSGSTKQELKGTALHEFLLKKIGRTWDDIILERATLEELDEGTLSAFLKAAIKSGRIYPEADKDDTATLLKKLDLMTPEGHLKAAAILLFGKRPMQYFIHSYFKIGKFGDSDSDLRFQDTVEGNIFQMVDKVLRLLRERYLVAPIRYEGIQRIEDLEYPEEALREAILNSICHKDYTSTTVQLSVYDEKLILWNPGKLPEELPIEKLKAKHSSHPRNKHIAEIFFRAGYIESWGRGIEKIISACKTAGLPEPTFEEAWGGVVVTFRKNVLTEDYLKKLGYNNRQIKAVHYLSEHLFINSSEYQWINKVGKTTAVKELQELINGNLLQKTDKGGRSTQYTLIVR